MNSLASPFLLGALLVPLFVIVRLHHAGVRSWVAMAFAVLALPALATAGAYLISRPGQPGDTVQVRYPDGNPHAAQLAFGQRDFAARNACSHWSENIALMHGAAALMIGVSLSGKRRRPASLTDHRFNQSHAGST